MPSVELLPFAKDGPKKLLVMLPQGLGYPQALPSPGNTQQELPGQLMVFIFMAFPNWKGILGFAGIQ